jgi:hypothetical protein
VAVIEAQQMKKRLARALERVPVPERSSTRSKGIQQAPSFDRDYWIRHAEGFRIDAVAGRLGFVEEISADADDGPILHVRAGLLTRSAHFARARIERRVHRSASAAALAPLAIQIAESRAA